ncbi:dirigent protein 21-like [Phragmites australis]|uniref:dirigent protein 21-like n=1 Tax=Phragmites australis TaxID=29695 RepID=UPI002D78641F|nr:dirigent protein 21-like [Phragmites australis]
MAYCKLYSVVLAVALLLAAGPALRPVEAASAHLHFYMHDVTGGPSPTAVRVVNGPRGYFGNTVVIDDKLTEGTSSSSTTVGHAQGYYMVASVANLELLVNMNVVLTSGPYAGSSITVVGRDDINAAVRELSVVGGTGQFRMARGYVLWKTVTPEILDLEIFVNP